MSGILFLRTHRLRQLVQFYVERIGCEIWQDQTDCVILSHDNFLFGFCERETIQADAMLTFFYESRAEVDTMYDQFKDTAQAPPQMHEKYGIYQFFATDPDGRTLEFQWFAQPVARFRSGEQILLTRRSVREFADRDIPEELLRQVLDLSRFAPTAYNSQSYYFRPVRDRATLEFLSGVLGDATAPIGRAPMAVAIGVDRSLTTCPEQDGSIAAYHLMLSAWSFGLGTCWLGSLDREDVKERLGVPSTDYIATVTPLGFPAQRGIEPPPRKELSGFIRE